MVWVYQPGRGKASNGAAATHTSSTARCREKRSPRTSARGLRFRLITFHPSLSTHHFPLPSRHLESLAILARQHAVGVVVAHEAFRLDVNGQTAAHHAAGLVQRHGAVAQMLLHAAERLGGFLVV